LINVSMETDVYASIYDAFHEIVTSGEKKLRDLQPLERQLYEDVKYRAIEKYQHAVEKRVDLDELMSEIDEQYQALKCFWKSTSEQTKNLAGSKNLYNLSA
ncbi:hypothetical protein N9L26_02305, partial [Candidatus Pacebacteria bacterium]|nr:hypothetical protein [Candidatus Paceibacterota bacterium]